MYPPVKRLDFAIEVMYSTPICTSALEDIIGRRHPSRAIPPVLLCRLAGAPVRRKPQLLSLLWHRPISFPEISLFINAIGRPAPRKAQLLSLFYGTNAKPGEPAAKFSAFINVLLNGKPRTPLMVRESLHISSASRSNRTGPEPATFKLQTSNFNQLATFNFQLSTNLQPATLKGPLPAAVYNLE